MLVHAGAYLLSIYIYLIHIFLFIIIGNVGGIVGGIVGLMLLCRWYCRFNVIMNNIKLSFISGHLYKRTPL